MENQTECQKKKWYDFILLTYLFSFLLIFAGQLLGQFIAVIPGIWESDAGLTAVMYAYFIGIWAVTLAAMAIVKPDRPMLATLWTKEKGNNWKWLLLGLFLGFAMNGICILVAWLHQDIVLSFDSFQPLAFFFVLITVFIQSSAEELVCRGFMYQKLRRRYQNPWVAMIGNSLFFALLHLMNDGVTALSVLNILVVGIFFSLFVYYYDSIWCAMAIHAGWNFTQNIIFGLPNSGIVVPFSVWKLDASTARDSFAYNVGFGIEGTIFADIVLILGCVVVIILGEKKRKVSSTL